MLPHSQRLSRQAFPATRGLRRANSPHFSISYGDSGVPGAVIIIPKKAVKSSVDRHQLKRRIAPLIQPYLASVQTLVVSVRAGAGTAPYPALRDELNSLLRSILAAR